MTDRQYKNLVMAALFLNTGLLFMIASYVTGIAPEVFPTIVRVAQGILAIASFAVAFAFSYRATDKEKGEEDGE